MLLEFAIVNYNAARVVQSADLHLSVLWICLLWVYFALAVGPGLHVRRIKLKNVIYKYKTSTLTPFVKPCDVVNLAKQNVFYVQSCVESAFMYIMGSTILEWGQNKK